MDKWIHFKVFQSRLKKMTYLHFVALNDIEE